MSCRKSAICKFICQSTDDWSSVISECQDYAECCGFLIRKKEDDGQQATIMGSMTLFPTKYPSSVYSEAIAVQAVYNELYHKVANDHEFLKSALAKTVETDEFVRQQWQIYETVHKEGYANPLTLAIVRSDYMYQCNNKSGFSLGQIEFNTMASSMAAVSSKVRQVYCYMSRILDDPSLYNTGHYPENNSVATIADGIIQAWKLYSNPKAVVMFILGVKDSNFADIRSIEYEVLERDPQVKVVMRTANVLLDSCRLTEDKKLIIDDGTEVALVYYRSFYSPEGLNDKLWDLRLLIERSRAIKSPSIQYQLAGSKKVQQELALPGMVERYLSTEKAAQVRNTFVGLYSLEGNDAIIEDARKNPHNYVLKPQREGGGNNTYGEDIIGKLAEIERLGEQNAYILMERINPPTQYNCKMSGKLGLQCRCEPTVTELGIYGTVIGSPKEIVHNTTAGYLLRTKLQDVDEGGFCAGFSAIDTPYLLNDSDMLKELSEDG